MSLRPNALAQALEDGSVDLAVGYFPDVKGANYFQVFAQIRLPPEDYTMRAQQIMTVRPVVVTRDRNLQEVAELMVEYDCGEIPVVDNQDTMIPVGVITDRDIVCRTVALGRNPLGLTATDCMTTPCVTVELNDKVEECCRVLEEQQLRRVLVVDKAGRLCGIISQADIAEFARPEQTIAVVREVSQRGNGRDLYQPLM